jgi:hypothetical protein
VYEEIFDSQTMDKTTFMNQMKARLEGYKEENEAYLKDHPSVTFLLGSDTPRYYSMADEKKMEGCRLRLRRRLPGMYSDKRRWF